jgi:2-oxoglutarate ferredoxin oxidoreductase subunit alpha
MKGNEAIAEAAVRAGCRFYAGYPITPQNEIPEYMARRLPEVGGNFVQGESEVASINLVYGSAQTGTRSMTSSSSCGISLMSEGISFIASARIPAVYVNVGRGGPGIGAIQPAQQDYLQATKASGNGGFQMIVLAPYDVQEAVDMTYAAFDIADRDRNPVLILADGVLGTIMEPINLPEEKSADEVKAMKDAKRGWALVGHSPDEKRAMIEPGRFAGQELQNIENAKLYETWGKDVQVEEYMIDDAEVLIAAYGVSARIAKSAILLLRKEGYKVGLIRPKTVFPFPYASFENLDYSKVKAILDVEMSIPAQMIWDVQHGVKGRCPIETCLRSGGEIMSRDQIVKAARELCER